jgi:hypothetical protein
MNNKRKMKKKIMSDMNKRCRVAWRRSGDQRSWDLKNKST